MEGDGILTAALRATYHITLLTEIHSTTGVISRFRFALRRIPSVAVEPSAHNTSSSPLPFPLRVPSAPHSQESRVMRFTPRPSSFSFSGITNRLFIPPRFRFSSSDATSGPPSYLVPRNSRGSFPVYSDVRNGGTRHLISIRNVEGNIKVCDPTPHDRSLSHSHHHKRPWLMTYFATFPTLN